MLSLLSTKLSLLARKLPLLLWKLLLRPWKLTSSMETDIASVEASICFRGSFHLLHEEERLIPVAYFSTRYVCGFDIMSLFLRD